MPETLVPIRNALAEAYMGDTKVALPLFGSPATFDQRVIEMLTGLGQHVDVRQPSAISTADIAEFLRSIHADNNAERIAWIQAIKDFVAAPQYASEYGVFASASPLVHKLFKISSVNPTNTTSIDISSSVPSVFLFSHIRAEERFKGMSYRLSGSLFFYDEKDVSDDSGYREFSISSSFRVNYSAGGVFHRLVEKISANPLFLPACQFLTRNSDPDPASVGPSYYGSFSVVESGDDYAVLSFVAKTHWPYCLSASGFNPRLKTHPFIEFSMDFS